MQMQTQQQQQQQQHRGPLKRTLAAGFNNVRHDLAFDQ